MRNYAALFTKRCSALLIGCMCASLNAQQNAEQQTGSASNSSPTTLTTSVRNVLVDVIVEDEHGNPVHGLKKDAFVVKEDGTPQTVLFFDAYKFDENMDYVPPKLPAMAPDSFVNLSPTPERGPLYVLLYDLVNIPQEDQVIARAQLVKFIEAKPAGARFAIFVSSDGLHLVQGFTSDKQELLAAVDPKSSRPHVPSIFLMGVNFGQGDNLAASSVFNSIAHYLAPMPGRKNLIWFSSKFPLPLSPNPNEPQAYQAEVKKTIDLLADDQIAVYPVDASGVVSYEEYAAPGDAGGTGINSDLRDKGLHAPDPNATVNPNSPSAGSNSTFKGAGYSLTASSYRTQDDIARMTGGRAVYSSNNLMGSFEKVTEEGGSYYTLAYSPSNKDFDGRLRIIDVKLKEGNYRLSYRHAYYGTSSQAAAKPSDSDEAFSAVMLHGAPEDHQLIFGTHVVAAASPHRGTSEEMINLRKAQGDAKGSLKSEVLQTYTIDYTVMGQQLQNAGKTSPQLEIAAAIYGEDGRILNSTVNNVVEAGTAQDGSTAPKSSYRMEIQLDAPLDARFMRFAVHDARTGKTGAMEIPLPLASAAGVHKAR
jgi:VWFA-related protein